LYRCMRPGEAPDRMLTNRHWFLKCVRNSADRYPMARSTAFA
jgi:hypothetical protein